MRAGRGADSGLVVMKSVAAERSGLGGGVCVRLAFTGIREVSNFLLTRRFLEPPLTLVLERSLTSSSVSITCDSFIDFAGCRIHTGGGNVRLPSRMGKGSRSNDGG